MFNTHEILSVVKHASETLTDYIFELWFLIIAGVLSLFGFFGKRMINKWDRIVESHVSDQEIDKRFSKVYRDMTNCQQELKSQISIVKNSVSEVHTRIDDIYHILINESSYRPARKRERKEDN